MNKPQEPSLWLIEEIYLRLKPENIDFLNRVIEGYDGLGILSTIDSRQGLVVIRVTPDTGCEVLSVLEHLDFPVEIVALRKSGV